VKKKLWTWGRILVSLVLMVLALRSVDLGRALHILKSADIRLLLVAFSLNILVTFFLTLRWDVLLKSQGLRVGFGRLCATYFTSLFFANILPTTIGGDLVRAYYVWKDTAKRAVAVASVLVERLIGSFSLFAIALVAAGLVAGHKGSHEFLLVVGLATLALVALVWLFFNRRFVAFLDKLLGSPSLFGLRVKGKRLYESMLSYLDKRRAALKVFGITLVLQVVVVFMWFTVGRALGFKIGLVPYFLYIPVIGVVNVLPLSINGWGLQEWSCVGLFMRAGLGKDDAMILSVVNHLIVVATSLIGGITFLARGEKPEMMDMNKEGED
jgi:uncharacterized protein (TIRG00374 family)